MLTIINGFVFSRRASGTGMSLSSWETGSEKWKAREFTKENHSKLWNSLQNASAPPRWIKTLNLEADMTDFISHASQQWRRHKLYSLWSNPSEQGFSQPSGPWASGTPTAPQLSRWVLCSLWEKNIFKPPLIPPNFLRVCDPASLDFSSRPVAKAEVGEEGNQCFILVPITQSARHFIYSYFLSVLPTLPVS